MAKEIIECKLKQTKMKLASDEISEAIKISSDGYNNQNKQQKLRAGKAFFPLPNLLWKRYPSPGIYFGLVTSLKQSKEK